MSEFAGANEESVAAWQANAEYWDEFQGDSGSSWQRELVFPAAMDLLSPLPPSLLEIACGNGAFARIAARAGAQVTATDASRRMLELARARTSPDLGIAWAQVDATDEHALREITGAPFEAAVCNMALMDMAEIAPLFAGLPAVLKPGAPFVVSVLHPAFCRGANTTLFWERSESGDGRQVLVGGVKITRYKSSELGLGVAARGQPVLQPYFDRPLEALLGTAFKQGWMLDGLVEPAFDGEDDGARIQPEWRLLPEIPPVIVFRFRHRDGAALD